MSDSTELSESYCNEISSSITKLSEYTKQHSNSSKIEDEQVLALLKHIPTSIKSILQNNYDSKGLKLVIEAIDFIINWISFDEQNSLQLLLDIFNEENDFFQTPEIKPDLLNQKKNIHQLHIPGPFATNRIFPYPQLYIDLLNYFGEQRGFDQIIDRFSQTPTLKLKELNICLQFVDKIRKVMEPSFARAFIVKIQECTYYLILNYTVEESKHITKMTLLQTNELIGGLLLSIKTTEHVGEITEKFQLDIIHKFFGSPLLEKRLEVLQNLNSLITMTTSVPEGGQQFDRTVTTKWITSDYLVDWILKRRIIEELLGAKMHVELLKRSSSIFKFLLAKSKFSLNHLELLWGCSIGKQEDTTQAIYNIIKELISNFKKEHIVKFIDIVSNYPIKDYTVSFIFLVERFCERCLHEDDDALRVLPIKNILWEAIQDESGSSDEVFAGSINTLKNLIMKSQSVRDFRPSLVSIIRSSLHNFSASSQSWILITQIFDYYYQYLKGNNNLAALSSIEQYLNDLHLIEFFFEEDFPVYNCKLQSLGPGQKLNRFTNLNNIEIRLEFITGVLSKYSRSLITYDYISKLWDYSISSNIGVEEADFVFLWFTNSISFFDVQSTQQIFTEKLMTLDPRLYTCNSFDCFVKYFTVCNYYHGNIDSLSDSFNLKKLDLIGLNELWNIALNNSAIVEKGTNYLCSLYNEKAQLIGPIYEQFISTIIEKIRQAISLQESINDIQSSQSRIERCIQLLHQYIKLSNLPKESSGTVTFSVFAESRKLDVIVPLADRLSKLREQLFKVLNKGSGENGYFGVENVMLQFIDYPIFSQSDYELTIGELGIKNDAVSTYSMVDKKDFPPVSTLKLRKSGPVSLYLSTHSHYFDNLYKLFDINPTLSESLWNLISYIPFNPQFLNIFLKIDQKSNPVWDTYMPLNSPYKLLYSLKIIESIISDRYSQSTKFGDWHLSFINSKAFHHIIRLFLVDLNSFGSLKKRCVESLLSILSSFLLSPTSTQLKDELNNNNNNLHIEINQTLIFKLLQVIEESSAATDELDPQIAKYSIKLFTSICISKPQLLKFLFDYPEVNKLIRSTILDSKEAVIREEFSNALCSLFQLNHCKDENHFLNRLIQMLPSIDPSSQTCQEYFSTLMNLLTMSKILDIPVDYVQLAQSLIDLLLLHPTIERNSVLEVDYVIIGIMNLISALISTDLLLPSDSTLAMTKKLIKELFYNCLFELPSPQKTLGNFPPKCKSKQSRAATFDLLLSLCAFDPTNYRELFNLIQTHHLDNAPTNLKWNISPNSNQLSPTGYVGIHNLGCICYMISLLQQLFMMPKFRRGILSIKDEVAKTNELLYQLQLMYANLQESQQRMYDPTTFVKANKDYDGNEYDPRVQMDVDEYFNIFCDRLENGLKGSPKENLLKDIWAGKLSNQFKCTGCNSLLERDEDFYTLSLDIKNKSDITQALEYYVRGEMLEGENAYMCEVCNHKEDALMRRCVKSLPNTLFIHLKRFEFDFDTMRKCKLNDYCEFPTHLNMEPYTKEGIAMEDRNKAIKEGKEPSLSPITYQPPEYYNYHLVGVLVHNGGADAGHYFSLIKHRKNNQWYEFNDDRIRPFNEQNIPAQCFGGPIENNLSSSLQFMCSEEMKSWSAYMLIYERNPLPPPSLLPPTPPSTSLISSLFSSITSLLWSSKTSSLSNSSKSLIDLNNDNHSTTSGALDQSFSLGDSLEEIIFDFDEYFIKSRKLGENFDVLLSQSHYDRVWEENINFFHLIKLFDVDYISFLLRLIELSPSSPLLQYKDGNEEEFKSLKVGIIFAFEILIYSRDIQLLGEFFDSLSSRLSNSIPACKWFIEWISKESRLKTILIDCPVMSTRKASLNLISTCVKLLSKFELVNFQLDHNNNNNNDDRPLPAIQILLDKLISLWPIISENASEANQFFDLINQIALLGIPRYYLLCLNLPRQILLLISELQSDPKKVNNSPVNLVNLLITLIQTPDVPPSVPAALLFTENFVQYLANASDESPNLLANLCDYYSRDNLENSELIIKLIIRCISLSTNEKIEYWKRLITTYSISINDKYQQYRIEFALQQLANLYDRFSDFPNYASSIASILNTFYRNSPYARKWFDDHRQYKLLISA